MIISNEGLFGVCYDPKHSAITSIKSRFVQETLTLYWLICGRDFCSFAGFLLIFAFQENELHFEKLILEFLQFLRP